MFSIKYIAVLKRYIAVCVISTWLYQMFNEGYFLKVKFALSQKYLSKSTLSTICHPSGFNKAGKSFSEGCLRPLMSESSTQNQQFCCLESVG